MMNLSRIGLLTMLVCSCYLFSTVLLKADPFEPGRALFNGSTDAPGKAKLGTTAVPASRFPCRNCHGRDGEGGSEGNVPSIVWNALSRPTSARTAFDETALATLLRTGMKPDGEMNSQLMPRYELDQRTIASLVDYLQALPSEQAAGITPSQINIGVLVIAGDGEHSAYAGKLQSAIDQCSNRQPLFGRRVVFVPLDARDPRLMDRISSSMAAIAGLPYSRDLSLTSFVELGIPIINPVFPLNGDEDDTIVRTMSPSWRDIFRILLDQARSDGLAKLYVLDTSGASDQDGTARTIIEDLAGTLKIAQLQPLSDESPEHAEQTMINPDTGILVAGPLANPSQIATLSADIPVYAPIGHVASHLKHLLGQGAKLKVAVENSVLFERATKTGQDPLSAHADLTANMICEAVRISGRNINRTRLIEAITNVRLPDVPLDWTSHRLTGTSYVPIEALGLE